jgi:hypothetical protein
MVTLGLKDIESGVRFDWWGRLGGPIKDETNDRSSRVAIGRL